MGMAPYTLPHIITPLFIVQALYDSWQSQNIVGLNCVASQCTNSTAYDSWLNMAAQMAAALKEAPKGSGVFAKPCHVHGQVNLDRYWVDFKVNGTSMRDAFARWWSTRVDMNFLDDRPYGTDCSSSRSPVNMPSLDVPNESARL